MKNILILGGGYGGVAAAQGLAKSFRNDKDVTITLIDKRSYHLFNSNLFEVATAEEEMTSEDQLKKSIGLPHAEVLPKKVGLIQAEVTEIDASGKTVSIPGKKVPFDYLVLGLGSVSDYFNIEGAEKYSLPMKNFPDALRIRNAVEFAVQAHRQDMNKPNIRLVVAGGGYTGVEFISELSHEIKEVAWKNSYPLEKIELGIVEATSQLIPGFSKRLSQDVLWKLKDRGVRVMLSSPIAKVDEYFLHLADGEKAEYDVLVWATGVKAAHVPFVEPLELDRKGRVITNQFLQTEKFPNIFALGDCACVINENGLPASSSAQDAIQHGRYVAYSLPLFMQNKAPAPYSGWPHGFIVTMGGKSAIVDYGGMYITGFLGFVVRQAANFRYYASVVGWWKAIKYLVFQNEVFGRND